MFLRNQCVKKKKKTRSIDPTVDVDPIRAKSEALATEVESFLFFWKGGNVSVFNFGNS